MSDKPCMWPFEDAEWWTDPGRWKPPEGIGIIDYRFHIFQYTIDYDDGPGPDSCQITSMRLSFLKPLADADD